MHEAPFETKRVCVRVCKATLAAGDECASFLLPGWSDISLLCQTSISERAERIDSCVRLCACLTERVCISIYGCAEEIVNIHRKVSRQRLLWWMLDITQVLQINSPKRLSY